MVVSAVEDCWKGGRLSGLGPMLEFYPPPERMCLIIAANDVLVDLRSQSTGRRFFLPFFLPSLPCGNNEVDADILLSCRSAAAMYRGYDAPTVLGGVLTKRLKASVHWTVCRWRGGEGGGGGRGGGRGRGRGRGWLRVFCLLVEVIVWDARLGRYSE